MLRNSVSTEVPGVHPWGSLDWVGLAIGSPNVIWARLPFSSFRARLGFEARKTFREKRWVMEDEGQKTRGKIKYLKESGE